MQAVLFLLFLYREYLPLPKITCHGDTNGISSKLSPKCVKIARPVLFGYIETREEFEFYTNELFSLLSSGQLKTKIHKIYPLEDIAQVHTVSNSIALVSWITLLTVFQIGSGGEKDYRQVPCQALICRNQLYMSQEFHLTAMDILLGDDCVFSREYLHEYQILESRFITS
jgi:hypothetical protein